VLNSSAHATTALAIFDPEAERIDLRLRSPVGVFDLGENRSRMQ